MTHSGQLRKHRESLPITKSRVISLKKMDWKGTAELVGIAAIVASLIFVGLQMRQEQEIAQAQAFVDAAAVVTDLNQYIENNRDVWIRGLDGAELSAEDKITFHALCRAVYLRKISHFERARRLGAGNPDMIAQIFAYDVHVYPGLRQCIDDMSEYFEERRQAFGHTSSDDSLTILVKKSLAELDRNPPPPPKIKLYYIN